MEVENECHAASSLLVSDSWVIENWQLRELLGSGGFSEVKRGVRPSLGDEMCAVKIINKQHLFEYRRERGSHLSVRSEMDMLIGLCNPGILRVFDCVETPEKMYISMELLEGGDMLQCILAHGSFREGDALRIFQEIAKAVDFLHGQDLVHRDLKPENLLLTTQQRSTMLPKLADFGLARSSVQPNDCLTICGTPLYYAPEIVSTLYDKNAGYAGGGYGKQADIWSLGVVLYIMISGLPPFGDDDLYEHILDGKYDFADAGWQEVSAGVKDLVTQLMCVSPSRRLTPRRMLSHEWFL